ncbi:MAG: aspartate/methionine/tyrosine aminotransferase [Desulforhopalus sp.]|jgi:aspartate/methionine/tyrosine aminotransferase
MSKTMQLADRVKNLGVETAFLVAGQAAAHGAAGNRVYPFHLGDMNLQTPANIIEAAYKAMRDGKNGYTPNGGIPQLREALASEFNTTRKTSYSLENVAVQPGGKPVISKFLLALMNPGDEVLYPNPGFPIYESQIRFHGGVAVPYPIIPGEKNFSFDLDALEAAITERTKLLIVNDLHNPTSAECSPDDRKRIAEIAVKYDLTVLLDEAYFDVRYGGESVSLIMEPGMVERSVILHTFSKKYAMTGWRVGAALGPKSIIDVIVKLNVNDESCTSHSNQYAACEALQGDQTGAQEILNTLQARRDLTVDLLNSIEGISCYTPNATFYLYPDVTDAMANRGYSDYQPFLDAILKHTGVSLCARIHFGTPLSGESRKYLRLAYSGIEKEMIEEGLIRLKDFLEK